MKPKITSLVIVVCVVILPSIAVAQTFVPLVGIPGVDANNPVLGTYINAIYRLSISLAALLAVIKIVAAGAKYMLSDIVTNKSAAKEDIKGALIGLLIVISAVLILTTVNSDLTKTDLLVTPVILAPPTIPLPTELDIMCGPEGDKCTRFSCSNSDGFWWSTYDYVIGAPICATQCAYYDGNWIENPTITTTGVCVYPNDSAVLIADMKAFIMEKFGSSCVGDFGCTVDICSFERSWVDCAAECTADGGTAITEYRGCLVPNTIDDVGVIDDVIAEIIEASPDFVAINAALIQEEEISALSAEIGTSITTSDILSSTNISISTIAEAFEVNVGEIGNYEISAVATALETSCTSFNGSGDTVSFIRTGDEIEYYCVNAIP